MAIFKASPIIGGISGSIQGITFANPRGSPVLRKRQLSRKSLSPSQLSQRASFQASVAAWATFSDAQRAAWRAAASQITLTNRLGLSRNLSGFQYYLWKRSGSQTRTGAGADWPSTNTAMPLGQVFDIESDLSVPLVKASFPAVVEPFARLEVWVTVFPSSAPLSFSNNWKLTPINAAVPAIVGLFEETEDLFGTLQVGQRWGMKYFYRKANFRFSPPGFAFQNFA